MIGVLALQGAFREHINSFKKLGVHTKLVRCKEDLTGLDGIVLPGGESTTMGKLLKDLNIKDTLSEMIRSGLPTWGTCAGLILLADENSDETKHLGVMNIKSRRNAYGRQLGSFKTIHPMKGIKEPVEMVFIRAPIIESVGENVQILAEYDEKIVAARQNRILATSFHPELTEDLKVHQYFIDMINGA